MKTVRIDCQNCDGYRMVSANNAGRALRLCDNHLQEHEKARGRNHYRRKVGISTEAPLVSRDAMPVNVRGIKIMRSDLMPEGAELEPEAVHDFLEQGCFGKGDLLVDMRTGERLTVIQRFNRQSSLFDGFGPQKLVAA